MIAEYTYLRDDSRPTFYPERFVLGAIDILVGIVEFVLGIRFVLHLLGAGQGNAFMAWLDGTTDQLLAPFSNIFPTIVIGGFAVEFTTLFAMIAYAVIGWLIGRAVVLLMSAARPAL